MNKLKLTGAVLGVALLAAAGIVVAQAEDHATTTETTAIETPAGTLVVTNEEPTAFEKDAGECLATNEGNAMVTKQSDTYKTCMMEKGHSEAAINADAEAAVTVETTVETTEE